MYTTTTRLYPDISSFFWLLFKFEFGERGILFFFNQSVWLVCIVLYRLIVKNDAGDYIGVLAIRDILKGLVDNLFA